MKQPYPRYRGSIFWFYLFRAASADAARFFRGGKEGGCGCGASVRPWVAAAHRREDPCGYSETVSACGGDKSGFVVFLGAFFLAAALAVCSPVNFSAFRALVTFSHRGTSFLGFKRILWSMRGTFLL
jgi:hypothetical protein